MIPVEISAGIFYETVQVYIYSGLNRYCSLFYSYLCVPFDN